MKRLYALTFWVLICLTCTAQNYQYGVWKDGYVYPGGNLNNTPTFVGPLNFMTLDVSNHSYIRLNYNTSTSYGYDNFEQTTAYGPNTHHQLRTTDGPDPCRCYNTTGNNYPHENYFPTSDIITKPDGTPVDTVLQIGSTSLTDNSQIEYWFYPQEDASTLLVCFSFAEEDVYYHDAYENPHFFIEVLDGQTGQLLHQNESAYCYPTEAAFNAGNSTPTNPNWPYYRFLAVPSGENYTQDHSSTSPDEYGIFNYYWAFPQATPTTFPFRVCPPSQNGGSSSYDVKWFEYKPIAFDLSDYAAQNKSVKLRIKARACQYFAHWNYALFYARMIPGYIQVDACGSEPIHLSVPHGFQEQTYVWLCGYDAQSATNVLDIGVTPGVQGTVYDVYIDRDVLLAAPGGKLWPYYCCKMKSYTGVPFNYEAEIHSYFLEPDFTFEQQFTNCDLRAKLIDSSVIYIKTPPGPGETEDVITYQATIQDIQWFVKNLNNNNFTPIPTSQNETTVNYVFEYPYIDTVTGEAIIKISIQDSLHKCSHDTIKSIFLDLSAIRDTLTKDTVYTCEEKLPFIFDQAYFGDTQTWSTEGTRRVLYQSLSWNGCDSLVDVTLVIQKPKVEITFDLDYCDAFSTTLTATCNDEISQYKWSTGETTPSITINTPGTYTVDILNEEGCAATNSINIPACKPFLNLPNSITPSNMDGLNDYFSIPQKSLIQELEFTVYNRYGEVVYHTTNKDFEWNGSENGQFFVGATYTYILRIVDYEGVSSNHKGSITVL